MRKKVIAGIAAALALALGGAALAYVIIRDTPEGQLDTELAGVTLVTIAPAEPAPALPAAAAGRFGAVAATVGGATDDRDDTGDHRPRGARRGPVLDGVRREPSADARAHRHPAGHAQEAPALGQGDGQLHGVSADLLRRHPLREHLRWAHRRDRSRHGHGLLWSWQSGTEGIEPGARRGLRPRQLARRRRDRLSGGGADARCGGSRRAQRSSRRRSRSTDTVYFGATDGRLFAVDVETGRVRWAYNTGGRINSSPSIWGTGSASPPTPAPSSASGAVTARSSGARTSVATLPVRELLRERVDRRSTPLHRGAHRQGRGARRHRRPHRVDAEAPAPSPTRRRRSPTAASSSAASTARCTRTTRDDGRAPVGALCRRPAPRRRPSSSATSSSSRRSRRRPTPRVSRTARSSGSIGLGKYAPGIATDRALLLLAERPADGVRGHAEDRSAPRLRLEDVRDGAGATAASGRRRGSGLARPPPSRAIRRQRQLARSAGRARRAGRELVAELGEQVAGDPLEARRRPARAISSRQSRSPGVGAFREARLVRLRRHVHAGPVVEHRRVVGQPAKAQISRRSPSVSATSDS